MIDLKYYLCKNWLITPAALAVGQPVPADIHGQRWLLMLSGVVILDKKGWNSGGIANNSRPVRFRPDVLTPCHFAIDQYSIPLPPGQEGLQYHVEFQVQQWCAFVGLDGLIDNDSDDAYFSVTSWKESPPRSGFDMFTGDPLNRLFDGIVADVIIQDKDTKMNDLAYKISMVGRIVFSQIRIT